MDPELARRLRRYGEHIDQVAITAQSRPAPAPPPAPGAHDTDGLAPVVPFVAARSNRRVQLITAAAAAAIVVVAGALVTWRITGDTDPGPADSTPATVVSTTRPSTSPTTALVTTTSVPIVGVGGSTSSTTTTESPGGSVSTPVTGSPPVCPDYVSYGSSYPIQLCDAGPAVRLIQQYTGAPVDGLFGPATRQSVRVFQEQRGLNADGLVGPLTWAAMFPNGAPGTDGDADGVVEPWEVG